MNDTNVQQMAVMLLAVATYKEVITEDTAIEILKTMDFMADGSDQELDQRATAVVPILNKLEARWVAEGKL